jgi:hypothetical protein
MGLAMAGPVVQAVSMPQQTANSTVSPPPIPGTVQYFLALEGRQKGPFTISALATQIATGVITQNTLVWTEGMEGWKEAGQVAELEHLFAGTPPPPPPAA